MPLIDAVPCLVAKGVLTDTASTDAFVINVPVPRYTVRRVTVYNASGNVATATLSVRGGPGGTGTSIVADAALTGVTGSTVVNDRTVAATGVTPAVTDDLLYIRIGTASGVAGATIDVAVVIEPLP
jgi:hypothetical protein